MKIFGSGLGNKAVTVGDLDNWLDWLVSQGATDNKAQELYASVAWTYWCVNLRANSVAKIPWKIYTLESDEDIPENEVQGWEIDLTQKLWGCEAWLSLKGAAYMLKRENRAGLQDLQVLNANTMSVEKWDADGPTVFKQQKQNEEPRYYKAEQIVYFRTFNPLDDIGEGVSSGQVADISGELIKNANAWAAKFFINGAIPAIFLTTDSPVAPEAAKEIENRWNRILQGVRKAFKTKVLPSGLKPTVIGQPISDLAMPDLEKIQREQILASHMIPPGLAEAKTNRAERDSLREELWTDAIVPEIENQFRPVLDEQLLNPLGYRIGWDFLKIEAIQRQELSKAESMSFVIGDVMLPAYDANTVSVDETRAVIDKLLSMSGLPELDETFTPEERMPAIPFGGDGDEENAGDDEDEADNDDSKASKKKPLPTWGSHRVYLPN
jgi:HK97 family phage portal protein